MRQTRLEELQAMEQFFRQYPEYAVYVCLVLFLLFYFGGRNSRDLVYFFAIFAGLATIVGTFAAFFLLPRTSQPRFPLVVATLVVYSVILFVFLSDALRYQRWSRFPGQNGGLAKVDSGFDYAANFSCSWSIA